MKYISRREAIQIGLGSLFSGVSGVLGVRWLGSGIAYAQTQRRICVSVHGPDGKHLSAIATVKLRPVGGGLPHVLNAEGTVAPVLYGGDVPEGEYDLLVENVGALQMPSCKISIAGEQKGCVGAYLYPAWASWCLSYRIGRSRIPFIYEPRLLGVLVPGYAANPKIAFAYARKLARRRVRPFLRIASDPLSWTAARGYIWFLSLDIPAAAGNDEIVRARQAAADTIRREFERDPKFSGDVNESIRIGVPVQLERGAAKVLERRYVVRFKKDPGLRGARTWIRLTRSRAKIVRRLQFASGAYLIEFDDYDHPGQLREVERWLSSGNLHYVEPDLIVELQEHACPSLPTDRLASCQPGLKTHRVPDAWCRLEAQRGPGMKHGGPTICIGLIEFPVDPGHPDLDTAFIKHCEGFNRNPSIPCYQATNTGLALNAEFLEDGLPPLHGTWVYGVGGATTENLQGLAGIAPASAKVIAVPPSGVAITTYCEMVLWLAGLGIPTGSSVPLLGDPGKPPAADVINCSHGVGAMPTPAQVCDTFSRVASEGRKGKGTLLVYSAGNGNSLIENFQAFADDPHVITVGATMISDSSSGPLEKRWKVGQWEGSNYGHSLDVCALGALVPTLDPRDIETYACGDYSFQKFSRPSGTSLSAPAVSAACALMLTANPSLSWCEARNLLRDSARRPQSATDPDLQEPGSSWVSERNLYFGSGSLDVSSAVSLAQSFKVAAGQQQCTVTCNYTTTCTGKDTDCPRVIDT